MRKLLFALFALVSLAACSDDSGYYYPVNGAVQNALFNKYPNATNVRWGSQGPYYIADFDIVESGMTSPDYKAWFTPIGKWYMTESDILYSALPAAVMQAFEASDYGTWRVDDVNMLEREAAPTIYVLEVESNTGGLEQEVDLYYSADGVLFRSVLNPDSVKDYESFIPSYPSKEVERYILQNYPNAQILDVERKGSSVEVEILDGLYVRALLFDSHSKWVRTITDINISELPVAVIQAIDALFDFYEIDEAEFVQTPDVDYYLIEVESGPEEVVLKIKADGTVL